MSSVIIFDGSVISPSLKTFAPIEIDIDISKLVAETRSLFLFVFSKTLARTGSCIREPENLEQVTRAFDKFS
jgi:hypothetical protein